MTATAMNLNKLIFAKTEKGQQEIQSRALGLSPKVRNALILVDGKRSGAELTKLVGEDFADLAGQLMGLGCVEAQAPQRVEPEPASQGPDAELAALPPAETRDAKQIEMARNFMMNTVNNIFGQNMRLTLISTIHACKTAEELRQAYLAWSEAMAGDRAGAKRLPEMREKLFAVL